VYPFYVDEVTLRHVHTQGRNTQRRLATFDIAIHNRYKDRRLSTGLSSHVSISYIVQFYVNVGTMIMTKNQSAQIEN